MEQKDELKKDLGDNIKSNESEHQCSDCSCDSDDDDKECSQDISESKENNIHEKSYEDLIKGKEESDNRFLRLQADFSNYKKRVEKDKEQIYAYATEDLITQLLPILDNFDRALFSVTNKEDEFYKGMEMIHKQTIEVLENNGLKEIEAIKEKFDPNFHQGVTMEENEDYEEGTIIDVFQKGYMLKDKVIRPSAVKVAK